MIPAATPGGPGHDVPGEGDDLAQLGDFFEVEPVPASGDEAADFFSALAALLLDMQAARRTQGEIPTPPMFALIRPDPRHARGLCPSLDGETNP